MNVINGMFVIIIPILAVALFYVMIVRPVEQEAENKRKARMKEAAKEGINITINTSSN